MRALGQVEAACGGTGGGGSGMLEPEVDVLRQQEGWGFVESYSLRVTVQTHTCEHHICPQLILSQY